MKSIFGKIRSNAHFTFSLSCLNSLSTLVPQYVSRLERYFGDFGPGTWVQTTTTELGSQE